MKIPIAFAAITAWSVTVHAATPGQNIQGRPTSTLYQTSNSGYDNMAAYRNGQNINGIGRSAPAFLIARFAGVYVDRINYLGLWAWDNMAGYTNSAALNGLNLGFGTWPTLATAYVERQNAFPAYAFDNMASYPLTLLDGLNGGSDNGASVHWNGPYAGDNPPGCNIASTAYPLITNVSLGTYLQTNTQPNGVFSNGVFGLTFLANQSFYVEAIGHWNNGNLPYFRDWSFAFYEVSNIVNNSFPVCPVGGVANRYDYACMKAGSPFFVQAGHLYHLAAYELIAGSNYITGGFAPAFTGFYDSNTVVTSDAKITVLGPWYTYFTWEDRPVITNNNQSFGPFNLLTFPAGEAWSNAVVVNGGASPSTSSTMTIQTFYNNVVSHGNKAKCKAVNLFAPDNLIAALTPIPDLSPAGASLWVNHNFVFGDLTVNGLVGNGSSKYLDTGFNPQSSMGLNSSALGVYSYAPGTSTSIDAGAAVGSLGWLYFSSSYSGNSIGTDQNHGVNSISLTSAGGGYYCLSRTTSTRLDLYFANSTTSHSSIGNSATSTDASFGSGNIFVFCYDDGATPAVSFGNARLSGLFLGSGFSSSDDANMYSDVQAARVSFGGGYR